MIAPVAPDAPTVGRGIGRWLREAATSRRPLTSIALFVGTVVAAMVAAAPVIGIDGGNPLEAYRALFDGSLGSDRGLAETLVSATPLLIGGLAVALALQGGLLNLGVEGQLVVGGLAAGAVGAELDLPTGVHLAAALAAGAAAGALWALVPALLKAFRGVHEVITTVMFNYVAFSLSTYLVSPGGLFVSETQPSATERIRPSAELPPIWEPTRLHAGFLLALALAVACWWYLRHTPGGFRLRMVGANPTAARFGGIEVARVQVTTLCLSGALAGTTGAVEVLGLHGRYFDAFSPGYGFDAIAVALLGMVAPIGVVAAALVIGILRAGSTLLQSQAGVSKDLVTVISGLVVAAVAGRVVVERWLDGRRARQRPAAAPGDDRPPPRAELRTELDPDPEPVEART
ncbi:ABC transporter permease [Iamia sp. SCSIO 61187]|uniref:ABC transporter permease n=1 Tax=Iamia sp. SCSIO 61187 TaxID=2722752 RepID=UPI001C62FC1D|nr:ABC transporter permease [Iamia sp. SCSIO 61187]QYG91029.1 ABC transporter permease [Iamia sp. SCSIO 61187]